MLSEEAIRLVRAEIRPIVEHADELHDALLTFGFLLDTEVMESGWTSFLEDIIAQGRAAQLVGENTPALYVAAERLHEARLAWPDAVERPKVHVPDVIQPPDSRQDAVVELIRGRLALMGPATPEQMSASSGLAESDINQTFAALEAEGSILRGRFTPGSATTEWCDRRLLSRIHRYTLDRLRAEIQPVSAADFMRFLLRWQHAEPGHRVRGEEGLAAVLEQVEGYELPGIAWETDVLSARCEEYAPDLLDSLCTSGRAMWGRLSAPAGTGNGLRTTGPLRSSPIAIWQRAHEAFWMQYAAHPKTEFNAYARQVHEVLLQRGASFYQDIVTSSGLLPTQVEEGLGELAAYGAITSDSFSGLRALLTPVDKRPSESSRQRKRGKTAPFGVHMAGRWSLLGSVQTHDRDADSDVEVWARLLLRRYGVIFRRLLKRETFAPPWRDLVRVLWRLEARGEIRGGRFVGGFAGEQFALPEAVGALRKMRNVPGDGSLIFLSAADPLNLVGIVTPGERIPAVASNRIGYRDGVPAVALEAGEVRSLENGDDVGHDVRTALRRRSVPPELTVFVK
jgi:ATP-dependent Lhr-like helicase